MLLNNRYQILNNLATGGCGETFLAEDIYIPSKRKCVIKQFKPSLANASATQNIKEKFRKEAEVLEVVGSYELIPQLYAYFEENNELYIAQEYIEGVTLTQQVKLQGALDDNFVRDFLVCCLSTLSYIHAHGFIHRDIRPDNIILRQKEGMPVLIDFGVIKDIENTIVSGHAVPSGTIIGSTGYAAPEQLKGHAECASDLYSLGMIAIFLLTGKHPNNFYDPQHDGYRWLPEVTNWEGLDRDLISTINKAIQSSIPKRFSTAKEMNDHLYNSQPRGCRVWVSTMYTPYMWKLYGNVRVGTSLSDFEEAMQEYPQSSGEYRRGLSWNVFD